MRETGMKGGGQSMAATLWLPTHTNMHTHTDTLTHNDTNMHTHTDTLTHNDTHTFLSLSLSLMPFSSMQLQSSMKEECKVKPSDQNSLSPSIKTPVGSLWGCVCVWVLCAEC